MAITVKSDRASWAIIVELAMIMGSRIGRKTTVTNGGVRCVISGGLQFITYRHGSPFMTVLAATY